MIGAAERVTTPREAVLRRGPMTLYRLRAEEGNDMTPRLAVPVVLVPSIINRARILDLRPGQSVAAHLLAAGLDVYLIDWGQPAAADAHLDLEAYALRLLRRALERACALSGARGAHLLGYCLGGTFSLIAATRLRQVASVLALTTPVDLSDPGAMGCLTDPRLVDLERLTAAWPVVPGPVLWASFQALDPLGNARKLRTLAGRLTRRSEDRAFRARFCAQESWLNDPVPMTAAVLKDVVGRLYRENGLARGTLVLGGRPVRLEDGRCPVLNLIARQDSIVPPESARALARLWGGPVETLELDGGHIGVTVGSRAPEGLWPALTRWLTERQETTS